MGRDPQLEALDRLLHSELRALDRLVRQELKARDKAVASVARESERVRTQQNEWRETVNDLASHKLSIDAFDVFVREYNNRHLSLTTQIDNKLADAVAALNTKIDLVNAAIVPLRDDLKEATGGRRLASTLVTWAIAITAAAAAVAFLFTR